MDGEISCLWNLCWQSMKMVDIVYVAYGETGLSKSTLSLKSSTEENIYAYFVTSEWISLLSRCWLFLTKLLLRVACLVLRLLTYGERWYKSVTLWGLCFQVVNGCSSHCLCLEESLKVGSVAWIFELCLIYQIERVMGFLQMDSFGAEGTDGWKTLGLNGAIHRGKRERGDSSKCVERCCVVCILKDLFSCVCKLGNEEGNETVFISMGRTLKGLFRGEFQEDLQSQGNLLKSNLKSSSGPLWQQSTAT